MSIKYNRNKISPILNTARYNSVRSTNGWTRYNPPPINNNRFGDPTQTGGISGGVANPGTATGSANPSSMGALGCNSVFTEGCESGYNFIIIDYGSTLHNIETNLNSSAWAPQGCGVSGTQINFLQNGDTVGVRGVCHIDISPNTETECDSYNVPSNTNIYVFYDVTSMLFTTAKQYKTAIENWANNTIDGWSAGTGNVYHIPVLHERWVLWAQYPLTGTLPPYYQVSGSAPSDMLQYNTLFTAGTGWFQGTGGTVQPGRVGPEDSSGTNQRTSWSGPLVTGTKLNDYNNSLPTPQVLQSTGAAISMNESGGYNRSGWNTDANGNPFFFLPQEGHTIPNRYNLGVDYVLTAADAADLTDIKSGDYNINSTPTTGNAGQLDAGGSQAVFCGGDVDALVICLSDETHQGHGAEQDDNSRTKAEAMYNGGWEGYHGQVKNTSKLTDTINNITNLVTDSRAIAEAKTHFFNTTEDNGLRSYVLTNQPNRCFWGSGFGSRSYLYDPTPTTGGAGYTAGSGGKWCVLAFDWENGIGGYWFKASSAGTTDCYISPANIKDYNGAYFPANGDPNGLQGTTNALVTVTCGQSSCPNSGTGYGYGGCEFLILTQPQPGYLADVKFHLDNVYGIIHTADQQNSEGCKFSTFYYVVTNNASSEMRVQNPLTTVAALEGTTLGTFSTSLVDDLDADGAPNGNQSNFLNLPRTPGGAVSVQALGYFNPYGINSYWHPNDQYGFDIANHVHFIDYGFKHYVRGASGLSGYNVSRGAGVTDADINNDLTSFISGGGIQCAGFDCIDILVVDDTGNPVENYEFDFNGSTVLTDSNGKWGDQVNPGIYSFLCNSLFINTSPLNPTDPTDVNMAVNPNDLGCNSWSITLTLKESFYTLNQNCILGCTDGTGVNNPVGSSAACNYDPTAGIDDGSCIYADCSDMCPDPGISPYTAYSGLGTYPNAPSAVFPYSFYPGGGDAYYSPNCPNCCVGGNTGLLPSDCVDCLGVCGGSAIYDDCGVCDGPGPDICGICFGDGTSCVGCMDPGAINFDPTATIPCADCCEYIDIECKIKEVARKVLESCPEDCDQYYKNLLLEVSMLYSSLLMITPVCEVTDREVNGIVTSIHRLLVKIECGMCKNC